MKNKFRISYSSFFGGWIVQQQFGPFWNSPYAEVTYGVLDSEKIKTYGTEKEALKRKRELENG